MDRNAEIKQKNMDGVMNQWWGFVENKLSETDIRRGPFRLPFEVQESRATRAIRGFVDLVT